MKQERHVKYKNDYTVPYRNLKTGDIYDVIENLKVINATNKNDSQEMVLYIKGTQYFVREKNEFNEKFIRGFPISFTCTGCGAQHENVDEYYSYCQFCGEIRKR